MGGGGGVRNIPSRRLYWDKMDGLLDLTADFTIYEVGIMNTHHGMDEDPPPEIRCFIFLKICWESILIIFAVI